MVSQSTQDYLKAIYELEEDEVRVTTTVLAERLKVAPPSVTGMLQKLAECQPALVNYERHHGATLTPAGRKVALEIVRHHRLLELYLKEALGFGWDQVHAEAERLEHVISEALEDKIADALGHPTVDPHGDPIPAKDGSVAPQSRTTLSQVDAGQTARVARVRDEDPNLLRFLAELGIIPDAILRVSKRPPFDGLLHVQVAGQMSHALRRTITDQVFVVIE